MKRRNILTTPLALLSGSLALAGCSGWSYEPPMHGNVMTEPTNLAAGEAAAPKAPATFTQWLATDYSGLASTLSTTPMTTSSGDWVDADYFSRKSLKAGSGKMVLPENNANWLVPLEQPYGFRTQLADGRTRLMTALDMGGRDRTPAIAARAQARYDCWVEEMERDWQRGANGTCRTEFLAALDEMESGAKSGASIPLAPAREYSVFFDFDKSSLSPEARRTIDAAADAVRSDSELQIVLVGKADLTGTDPYNMSLSHQRADIARDAFLADGVPLDRIDTRWVGEREPPVPTANGVREPRNRVVEVTLH